MKTQAIPQRPLVVVPQDMQPAKQATPDAMIFAAIAQKVPIAELKELYALKREYEADEARKAYVAAMAEFKRDPPEIFKRTLVSFTTQKGKTEYMHADLGEICQQVVSALAQCGFSHSWEPKQDAGKITVTCRLTHAQGHSEAVSLTASADDSGGKNAIQSVASTVTYLQRYSLLSITGLATKGMDDDGKASQQAEYLTDAEQANVHEWIETSGADKARFLEALGFDSVSHIPRSQFIRATNLLKQKANAKERAHG